MSHSSEPWRSMPLEDYPGEFDGFFRVLAADDQRVAVCPSGTVDGIPVERGNANARRIVACVNACRGISTEELIRVAAITPVSCDPRYLHTADEANKSQQVCYNIGKMDAIEKLLEKIKTHGEREALREAEQELAELRARMQE